MSLHTNGSIDYRKREERRSKTVEFNDQRRLREIDKITGEKRWRAGVKRTTGIESVLCMGWWVDDVWMSWW
jgi:protein tyrosine/serine phosphatase